MQTITTPTMLTLRKASELAGISYDALRRMCLRHEIQHIRVGEKRTKFLVNYEKLVDYLNGGAGDE